MKRSIIMKKIYNTVPTMQRQTSTMRLNYRKYSQIGERQVHWSVCLSLLTVHGRTADVQLKFLF